jgi:hypothetical protein
MLAFVRAFFPVIPLLLGVCLGVLLAAAFKRGGKKKARIAELKARVEALERKA